MSKMYTTDGWDITNITTSPMLSSEEHSFIDKFLEIITKVLISIALVTNITGNVIIIVAVSKYHWLRKPLFATIQMLAVADLSVCLHMLHNIMRDAFFYPRDIHNLVRFTLVLTIYSATFHVGLAAMERFVAIRFPLRYRAYASTSLIRKCSAVAWTLAVGMDSLQIYIAVGEMELIRVSNSVRIFGSTLPVSIVFVIYTIGLTYLHWKITAIAKQRNQIGEQSTRNGQDRKLNRAMKMMIIIVALYILLWIPFVVVTGMASVLGHRTFRILTAFVVVAEFNSPVNILVYYHHNWKLRKAIRIMLNMGNVEKSPS